MKSLILKFLRLSLADKFLFAKAVVLCFSIRIGIKLSGFNFLVTLLNFFDRNKVIVKNEMYQLKRHYELMKLLHYLPVFMVNCLSSSLTFHWLLKRKGISTQLKFGVKKEKELLLAHAWLEHRNIPFSIDPFVHEKYDVFSHPIL